MTIPENLGIESEILDFLRDPPRLRARFRIVENGQPGSFQEGNGLHISVAAHLFEPGEGTIVDLTSPSAAGSPVSAVATEGWLPVDLPLPQVLFGDHLIAAKVFSEDERYRKPFQPSHCWVYRASFGQFLQIDRTTLDDLFRGLLGNPQAEAQLRADVRAGRVLVEENGKSWRALPEGDSFRLEPMPFP